MKVQLNNIKCVNGGECVQERQRCDGILDCSDSSDESNCPTIQPGDINLRVYPIEQTILVGKYRSLF